MYIYKGNQNINFLSSLNKLFTWQFTSRFCLATFKYIICNNVVGAFWEPPMKRDHKVHVCGKVFFLLR